MPALWLSLFSFVTSVVSSDGYVTLQTIRLCKH